MYVLFFIGPAARPEGSCEFRLMRACVGGWVGG